MLDSKREKAYTNILREELLLATGCTEPIAIAYCAARMRQLLGKIPERVEAEVSGNIIKNVKSVIVPNTGGLKGIRAAIAAGVIAGDADKVLQVISFVPGTMHPAIKSYAEAAEMTISCMDSPRLLDIRLTGFSDCNKAVVQITNNHSNIVYEEKNKTVLKKLALSDSSEDNLQDKSVLNIRDIVEFADTADLTDIAPLIEKQIECNSAIAQEGIKGNWGASIGKTLLNNSDGGILAEAKAYAAAGSDARMSGCEMPVVIVSGSGNQGIAASLPVIRYARYIGTGDEELIRALIVADLVTIHQKTGIGRLSAYCGSVSAGCGAGAGIAYLTGGGYEGVAATVSNAVAILSGTICDGAKPSCAAKIALSVEAGMLGYNMFRRNQRFEPGDGIVGKNTEATIVNVGRLARDGMYQTDRTILDIMTDR